MSPYYRTMPGTWWFSQRSYFLFMLRELTSVVIAAYLVLLLLMVNRLSAGPQSYDAYLRWLATPGMVLFHVVALAAALFHTVTWFNITPNVLVVRVGERRIPAAVVAGVNYAAWIAVSIVLAWIVLRS